MKNIKWLSALAAACAIALFSGCASVPAAKESADKAAKEFKVQPGKANIYVYRNETFGAAVTMPVALDGKLAGKTASKTYFAFEVEPGQHEILSETEDTSKLQLNVEAGANYYVWQEVKMGVLSARSKLQTVDAQTGQKGVQECKLIDSPLPQATGIASK
ncbi:Protein of unknown function [Andreprevotia lacus DSM 23236]|jgi:PBP1b-binding outer membrane lipoprotein LpoB|uniref:DUF2846 domain-containing protein n=1 Tax=Andreprevotia lacus DSM 23236 TaxID=1121001 RepID=A0A1W1XZ34_9NEIS|nr:DUF2846 domain-containing protein [Andreprevotia lacus]SMC29229.1 Protein of unknown function [Andreprevotia lacus DSM 23236]